MIHLICKTVDEVTVEGQMFLGGRQKNRGKSFFRGEGQTDLRRSVMCYRKKRYYRNANLDYRKNEQITELSQVNYRQVTLIPERDQMTEKDLFYRRTFTETPSNYRKRVFFGKNPFTV
jgi:hypothetical protein